MATSLRSYHDQREILWVNAEMTTKNCYEIFNKLVLCMIDIYLARDYPIKHKVITSDKALANEDTDCCRHIVADTNVSPFARARNICCGHKFRVRDTKNVSDFVQKHFVSATNVSQFAQPKKNHEQQLRMCPHQCVLVCQGV